MTSSYFSFSQCIPKAPLAWQVNPPKPIKAKLLYYHTITYHIYKLVG
jgi:hypothetical protein